MLALYYSQPATPFEDLELGQASALYHNRVFKLASVSHDFALLVLEVGRKQSSALVSLFDRKSEKAQRDNPNGGLDGLFRRWHLDEMIAIPSDVAREAQAVIMELEKRIESLRCHLEYVAGSNTPCKAAKHEASFHRWTLCNMLFVTFSIPS